ncbi:MAG: TPM domain-containing protein [Microcoleus sp. PH2017_25_DOB_D_A]|uniref:TPM domain-containing protein n=1 Tax=unclassified Microcoleus TaxID=2642155 RepID=UPI001D95D64B|nr:MULTISPECIES: TPM domain-containing protein [unclassified Microcoleus]MCC3537657.1 TPM domain-containing protein [Microcoleus sp. PH2017_25_DOB_D_A]MCC3549845.1 TPM domain-containing protein [Microcoleus sp. PH2017_24_DOB_U_A]
MHLQSRKKLITFSSLLCLSAIVFPVASQAITVQEVPNPRQNHTWVTDKANILSDSTEIQLNQVIAELEAKNGSEIAVVTVPDTKPSATPKAFATELFNSWGIGKKGKNNGVLLLISSGERRVQIETGTGIQGILPDAKTVSIIQTEITPKFKQQDFDGGTLAGTKALVNVLQTPIANVRSQNALPLAPIVPGQGVQPSANTQSQNTLPLAPIVPGQGVTPSPIPAQSPVVTDDNSSGGVFIFFLILALPVLLIGWIIRSIMSSSRSSSNSRRRHYGNRTSGNSTNGYGSSSNDYSSSSSSSSSDYSSSSSSDSGGSFGGSDSGGGGGGGDY